MTFFREIRVYFHLMQLHTRPAISEDFPHQQKIEEQNCLQYIDGKCVC